MSLQSIEAVWKATKDPVFSGSKDLISCDGIFDTEKKKNLKGLTLYCINPEGYRLKGNMEEDEAVNFNMVVERCKATTDPKKTCKSPEDIDDFIDHLIIGQVTEEKKIQINNHDINPPLLEFVDYRETQLDSNSTFTMIINLRLNTYELNDNPMTFLYPPPS